MTLNLSSFYSIFKPKTVLYLKFPVILIITLVHKQTDVNYLEYEEMGLCLCVM